LSTPLSNPKKQKHFSIFKIKNKIIINRQFKI